MINITFVVRQQGIIYLVDRVRLMSDPGVFQDRLKEVFKTSCSLFFEQEKLIILLQLLQLHLPHHQ